MTGTTVRLTKRLFDLAFVLPGLFVLSPVFLLITVLVAVTDRGPVLFGQERVGRNGIPFRMLKFRSMYIDAEKCGGQLTVGSDPRVTSVGRWLRKAKLDELPQLINVLRGEMSLVGPRPEVPRYVKLYTPEQRAVLQLTPGITDLASVKYRNESEVLAQSTDPEKTYIEEIMPEKIAINLSYAANASVFSDFITILRTFARIVY